MKKDISLQVECHETQVILLPGSTVIWNAFPVKQTKKQSSFRERMQKDLR